MEVIDPQTALLTNFEVYSFLKSLESRKKRNHRINQDENTVEYELVQYLENTPVSQQNPEQIASFMEAMNDWPLTKIEKLQLLNLRPMTVVQMNPIIEECDLRFDESKSEGIIELLDTHVPYTPPPDPNAQADGDEQTTAPAE